MPGCPFCSARIRGDAMTCPSCGRPLGVPTRPDVDPRTAPTGGLPEPPPWSWRHHRPPRWRRTRPGSAILGWAVYGWGLLFVWSGAAGLLDPLERSRTPVAASMVVLGLGFVLVVLGWRMGRERRPLPPLSWLSRLLNVPGLVDSMRSSRPRERPRSRLRNPELATAESRNAAIAVAAGLAWLLGALVAIELEIRWFPPRPSVALASFGTAFATAATASASAFRVARGRPRLRLLPIVAAIAVPIVAVRAVPGLGGLRTTPIPGRPAYALTAMPDGRMDLYLVLEGGDRIVRLTRNGTATGGADLSPDGRHVAFGDSRFGTPDLFVIDLDPVGRGLAMRRLTSAPGAETQPRWSPDGSRIVFQQLSGSWSDLAVIDPAGGPARLLTHGESDYSPTWSPDGRRIVFAADSPAGIPNLDVWEIDADGANRHLVLDSGGNDLDPILSADGTRLLFSSDRSGDYDVWVANADGTGAHPLTAGCRASDRAIGWSPDGRFAVFASNRSETGGNFIYFEPVGGGEATLAVVL